MKYTDYLRFWIDVLMHPGKATKHVMSISEALKLYYRLSIVPMVLGLVVVCVVGGFNPFGASSRGTFRAMYPSLLFGVRSVNSTLAGIAYLMLLFLALIPIDILINSAAYHLIIGKLFRIYNKKYNSVVTAVLYGTLPSLLVYWLYPAGFFGVIVVAVFGLWGLIVEIISLSSQLGMSRLKTLGTFVLYIVIVAAIAFVFGFVFAVAAAKL